MMQWFVNVLHLLFLNRNLEVDFSVKVCEAGSMPFAILTINDCDGILRHIYSVLGEASNGFYVEVRYLEQILTFTGKSKKLKEVSKYIRVSFVECPVSLNKV